MLGAQRLPRPRRASRSPSWLVGIPGLVLSWVTAVAYVPKIRAGIAAGRAAGRRRRRSRGAAFRYGCAPMNVPEQLRYSSDHEWVSRDGDVVRVGITDYAQDALGDVVFVQVPTVGPTVAAGDSFGEVESTKSVSDVYAPVTGTVVEVNEALADAPQSLNEDPYGDGWICTIRMSDPDAVRRAARRRGLPGAHRGLSVAYVFCNHCGHRNPPDSSFCSSCGSALDIQGDRTITLTAVDPLQDAPGADDDVVVPMADLPDRRRRADRPLRRPGRRPLRARRRRHPPRPPPRQRDHARRHHRVPPPRRRSSAPTRATSSPTPGRSTAPTSTRSASSGPCCTTATSCRSASSASCCSSGPMAEPGAAHLSIGEVLGLLLEEFPDVTISKIRFLESQGLIEPERTPSGYRKFFDDDVELLRVILREQREKFLPLRVIKDRIDSGPDRQAGDPTPPQARRRPADGRPGRQPPGRRRDRRVEQPTPGHRRRAPGGHAVPARRRPPRPPTHRRRRRSRRRACCPACSSTATELCAMASVTTDQLAQLEEYGVVPKRSTRRALRRGRGRDRRRRRRVPAGRRRRPPPAGLADVGRARGRALRAADPAGAAPAQPAGPQPAPPPSSTSSTRSAPSCGRR